MPSSVLKIDDCQHLDVLVHSYAFCEKGGSVFHHCIAKIEKKIFQKFVCFKNLSDTALNKIRGVALCAIIPSIYAQ